MLDAGGPLFADRAFFSVSRIRCSHQLAEIGNGILFLQRQHDNWATGNEIRKRVKERLAGMNGVELLRRSCQQRSEEHTSELQSRGHLVCRLLLEKKKKITKPQCIDSIT